ncbi:MAG: DEAD/DEAH box helicase [Leptospiraceae bacterium]|nr:DEAD/DEAH box helicase [Leptospiraceae bacterium]
MNLIAPSQRIRCRNAEWLVKSIKSYSGRQILRCVGIDPLVKNQERIFIEPLDTFEVIEPEDTKLVEDDSNQYKKTKFYLEARLRSIPLLGRKMDWEELGVFNLYNFQKTSVLKALQKVQSRLLIADAVGLGKTIQVGMIVSELMRRGTADKILVLTKKSMLKQFQSELWNKFNIPLIRMDSEAISKLRTKIPSNKNPFDIYHKAILSIDTLKQSIKYEHFLEEINWDIVIIDEAHNVAGASGIQKNESYRLARLLSKKAKHFLLTTATPHNGKKETFGRLLSLVDPSSMPDPNMEIYDVEDIRDHFVMRFKEEVRREINEQMKEAKIISLKDTSQDATESEKKILEMIASLRNQTKKVKGKRDSIRLLQYGYYKLFLSSPEALKKTLEARLNTLSKNQEEEISGEEKILKTIQSSLSKETISKSTRFAVLLKCLKEIGWDGSSNSPRVLVFTEYVQTEKKLSHALAESFSIPFNPAPETPANEKILMIDGSTPEKTLMDSVEAFATGGTSVRIMIATDVASEGINLHHSCHHIIHYDLPWSVITLIQRNGRIDRIGQTITPEIRYLKVNSGTEAFSADEKIFDKLTQKAEEINKLRKEAESVLNLFDAERETQYIGEKIIEGENPETILEKPATLDLGGMDEMEELMRQLQALNTNSESETNEELLTGWKELYTDKDFFLQGYNYIKEKHPDDFLDLEETENFIGFTPPEEVKKRLGSPSQSADLIYGATSLAPEVWRVVGNQFRLSDDKEYVLKSFEAAKVNKEMGHWSNVSYLNRHNPIMNWLTERLLLEFARGEAPLIISKNLSKDNLVFFFIGQVSSKTGEPLLILPHAVKIAPGNKVEIMSYDEFLKSIQIKTLVNTKNPPGMKNANILIPKAVARSKKFLKEEMEKVHTLNKEKSTSYIRTLSRWSKKKTDLLKSQMSKMTANQKRFAELDKQIEETKLYVKEKTEMVQKSFEHEDNPLTELILVVEGSGK